MSLIRRGLQSGKALDARFFVLRTGLCEEFASVVVCLIQGVPSGGERTGVLFQLPS